MTKTEENKMLRAKLAHLSNLSGRANARLAHFKDHFADQLMVGTVERMERLINEISAARRTVESREDSGANVPRGEE